MQVQSDGQTSWLNFNHLYYFMVIATEGSIARAAEKLRLGQPTLSAQLKQFEEAIGFDLFERQHKKLLLTENGKMALAYAQQIFRLGGEMFEALNDRLVPNWIHVQLGALDSVPKEFALRLARAAYAAGPCTVSFLEGKGDELLRELSAHRLDLFMANFTPHSMGDAQVVARRIARFPVSVFGGAKFKGLKKDFPKSLHHQPFIMPTIHSKLRGDLEHHFRLAGLTVSVVAETQDTSLQRLLAKDGVGLVAAASESVSDLLKDKSLVKLGDLSGVFEEFFLLASSRQIENPISSRLMKSFQL